MRQLKTSDSWKHRKMYETFIFRRRKPVMKVFDNSFARDACRVSLVRIKKRREETFHIIQKGLSITISDERRSLYEDSY